MNCCNHSDHQNNQQNDHNNQKEIKDNEFSWTNLGHALHWIIMIGIGVYVLIQFISNK